jgi:hypothetical protein
MVPGCAVLIRLLVTALLCVAGLARPSGQRSESPAELRAGEPMELSAATREGEMSRVRKRGVDEPDGDSPAFVEDDCDRDAPGWNELERPRQVDATHAVTTHERPRARGPPAA